MLVVANMAASTQHGQLDLSGARRFSLSRESQTLAGAVRSPMRITAFLNAEGPAARDARFLMSRYHEINHRITTRVVDPDENPGEAKRFRIGSYASVVVESWEVALHTMLAPNFGLWEFIDIDLHEPLALRNYPRYVP